MALYRPTTYVLSTTSRERCRILLPLRNPPNKAVPATDRSPLVQSTGLSSSLILSTGVLLHCIFPNPAWFLIPPTALVGSDSLSRSSPRLRPALCQPWPLGARSRHEKHRRASRILRPQDDPTRAGRSLPHPLQKSLLLALPAFLRPHGRVISRREKLGLSQPYSLLTCHQTLKGKRSTPFSGQEETVFFGGAWENYWRQ